MGFSFKVDLPAVPMACAPMCQRMQRRKRVIIQRFRGLQSLFPISANHVALRSITDVAMQRLPEHSAALSPPVPRVTLVMYSG